MPIIRTRKNSLSRLIEEECKSSPPPGRFVIRRRGLRSCVLTKENLKVGYIRQLPHESLSKHETNNIRICTAHYTPRASALGTAPPDLGRCTLRFYGESRSKVSFVANFTAEWNHEEHCAEEPFTHALAARPVCALTLAPRATVTFVHMHSIANFPEGRPDQGHSFLQKSRPTERGYSGAVIKTRFDH